MLCVLIFRSVSFRSRVALSIFLEGAGKPRPQGYVNKGGRPWLLFPQRHTCHPHQSRKDRPFLTLLGFPGGGIGSVSGTLLKLQIETPTCKPACDATTSGNVLAPTTISRPNSLSHSIPASSVPDPSLGPGRQTRWSSAGCNPSLPHWPIRRRPLGRWAYRPTRPAVNCRRRAPLCSTPLDRCQDHP